DVHHPRKHSARLLLHARLQCVRASVRASGPLLSCRRQRRSHAEHSYAGADHAWRAGRIGEDRCRRAGPGEDSSRADRYHAGRGSCSFLGRTRPVQRTIDALLRDRGPTRVDAGRGIGPSRRLQVYAAPQGLRNLRRLTAGSIRWRSKTARPPPHRIVVYSTCLFCNQELGVNSTFESFPIGRRLAFDPAKGRLWVVCRKCERWNLSPLDERWEAIEQAEQLYSDTRRRVATAEIGLARLADGTELVRIGAPLRPEFAAWRYGDQFGRRRNRQ